MKAVVLQRDPRVSRRICRVWRAAGLQVIGVADPEELRQHLSGAVLLGADEFDRDVVLSSLREAPGLRACLWTAEPMTRCLRVLKQEPRIVSVLGRSSFEATPREWELVMVAHRALSGKHVPFAGHLRWGFTGFEVNVRDTSAIEGSVARAETFVSALDVAKWMSDLVAELTHELLMNAVYDAPVDSHGRPRFAHDRKARVELPANEAAILRVGCDGVLVCVQVVDPFGRLSRDHVVDGLVRGLQSGELDQSHGGAGLGMAVCHNSTIAMIYDLDPGRRTVVTGFFDLDTNRRDFRSGARSLHFFQPEPARK